MQEYIDFITNNSMLAIAWIAIAGMLIHSIFSEKMTGVTGINSQDAITLINNKDAIIVDVSGNEKFKAAHIVNSKNIPLEQIKAGEFQSIKKSKEMPIIVVCGFGNESVTAGKILAKAGFTDVYSLNDGISGWTAENLPTTRK